MEEKPVFSEDHALELRRTTLVPLIFSLISMAISWTAVVLSYFSDLCQSIYNLIERDLEATRYISIFTGIIFTIFFIISYSAWKKRGHKLPV